MVSVLRKDFFVKKIPQWQKDPNLFFREVLDFTPDTWQQAVNDDLAKHPKVAVKSGQGVGKTADAACLFLWFLFCFPNSRVVATAPSKQQLHDVLWSEIAKWQERSPLLQATLKWTKTYVTVKGKEKRWFGVARTATKAENMQGFHAPYMLFIVEEASGIDEAILEAILGTLSGPHNKILMIGNPTKLTGTFHDAFTRDRALYRCHTVNAELVARSNKENIAAMKQKYGANSNFVRVRIHGEFPLQEDDVFIQLSDIMSSVQSDLRTFQRVKLADGSVVERVVADVESIDIGCDVARFGDDKTCIAYKVNEMVKFHMQYRGRDTMTTANEIARLALDLKERYNFAGKIPAKIDVGSMGGGVVDKLNELKEQYPERYDWLVVVPVDFGRPIKHRDYYDTTTLMMALLRDMIATKDDDGNTKAPDVVLPDNQDMIAQFSTRKYGFRPPAKAKIESKEDFKKRTKGTSPDEADCVLLTVLPVYNLYADA